MTPFLVMAELGSRSDAARAVLVKSMEVEKDPFIRFAATTRLAMMGEPEGWKALSQGIAQPGKKGFVAAYMLGELGRDRLIALGVRDRLDAGKDGDRLAAIANRIQQGLDDVDAELRREINPYIRKYAQMIKQDLLSFEIAPGSHIRVVLPGS